MRNKWACSAGDSAPLRRYSTKRCRHLPTVALRQCSPDGKYIAAVAADSDKIVLFDFAPHQWSEQQVLVVCVPLQVFRLLLALSVRTFAAFDAFVA
jgi:hypothetical protein